MLPRDYPFGVWEAEESGSMNITARLFRLHSLSFPSIAPLSKKASEMPSRTWSWRQVPPLYCRIIRGAGSLASVSSMYLGTPDRLWTGEQNDLRVPIPLSAARGSETGVDLGWTFWSTSIFAQERLQDSRRIY